MELAAAAGTGSAQREAERLIHRQQPMLVRVSSAPSRPLFVQTSIWLLGSLSVLAVWLLLYALVLSGVQEASAQRSLYATLRSEISQEVAPPFGPRITLGAPVAVLQIPQAGVNDVVLEGTTSGILESGPGLETDTPLPGQPGVSIIDGRQTMFGGPFRHLSALQPGDLLQVTTGQGVFTYEVHDLRYPGDPLPTPLPPGGSRLILVTTTGSGWRGAGAPNQFLYVDTMLVGTPAAVKGGAPSSIPADQMPMHGDPGVLIMLVFWLQLLVVLVLATVWAHTRWSVWQTWLVAAPAFLAVLWISTEVAFQMLPNLI